MARTTLAVEGMSCDHCVRAVTQALDSLAGVHEAVVDLATGHAVVDYDADRLEPAVLISAVREAGYDAQLLG